MRKASGHEGWIAEGGEESQQGFARYLVEHGYVPPPLGPMPPLVALPKPTLVPRPQSVPGGAGSAGGLFGLAQGIAAIPRSHAAAPTSGQNESDNAIEPQRRRRRRHRRGRGRPTPPQAA
jgi:hypothetical protein